MAYIAFGSNLGDRRSNIKRALELLVELSEGEMKVSSLWESAPADMSDEAGRFLNGVVSFRTSLAPHTLLEALQSIEETLGRPRQRGKNQSRTIDLDIICLGDLVLETPDLVIPHPRARDRKFVLAPLAELDPDMVLPGESETVKVLDSESSMEISRLSGPL